MSVGYSIGCFVWMYIVLGTLAAGVLVSSLDGAALIAGFAVYIAVSMLVWAGFWYYRDEFR